MPKMTYCLAFVHLFGILEDPELQIEILVLGFERRRPSRIEYGNE
jgi:hypothetical protein